MREIRTSGSTRGGGETVIGHCASQSVRLRLLYYERCTIGVGKVQRMCRKGVAGGFLACMRSLPKVYGNHTTAQRRVWFAFAECGYNCFGVEYTRGRQSQGSFRRCAVFENNHWAVA